MQEHNSPPGALAGPFVEAAKTLLRREVDGTYTLASQQRAVLEQLICDQQSAPRFVEMIAEFCAFAAWLREEHGSISASDTLLEVAESALSALRRSAQQADIRVIDDASRAVKRFRRFCGARSDRTTPAADNGLSVKAGPLAQHVLKKDGPG